jgi:carbamoyl-phosphate synthase small subunit
MSFLTTSLRSSLRRCSPVGVRSLASAVAAAKVPATLHLKSGQSFTGTSFGSTKSIWGETVFSTSITSCQSR